jgi:hypothetical protein
MPPSTFSPLFTKQSLPSWAYWHCSPLQKYFVTCADVKWSNGSVRTFAHGPETDVSRDLWTGDTVNDLGMCWPTRNEVTRKLGNSSASASLRIAPTPSPPIALSSCVSLLPRERTEPEAFLVEASKPQVHLHDNYESNSYLTENTTCLLSFEVLMMGGGRSR